MQILVVFADTKNLGCFFFCQLPKMRKNSRIKFGSSLMTVTAEFFLFVKYDEFSLGGLWKVNHLSCTK